MAAPKGNQFWKLREKHGRDTIFESPSELWEKACEYFQWCDEHPWVKNEAVKAGDHFGELVKVPTSRPYTLTGLCYYLGVGSRYFDDIGEDFSAVEHKIKQVIDTQQFEGAAVGAYNASIIARKLGLSEKVDHTSGGEKIEPQINLIYNGKKMDLSED